MGCVGLHLHLPRTIQVFVLSYQLGLSPRCEAIAVLRTLDGTLVFISLSCSMIHLFPLLPVFVCVLTGRIIALNVALWCSSMFMHVGSNNNKDVFVWVGNLAR